MIQKKYNGGMIEVRDLVKDYGGFRAVDRISFSVAPGKIFGLLGPNGAGKTTTIKMLTTALEPTSGSISVADHDPRREPDQVRRAFGIVFQDPSLDEDLTAAENMEFHGVLYGVSQPARRERIEGLLRFVGLWERRDAFVKQYSGGMKRRLEIARALLHSPKILFLDEPTLGLDPQTRNHIWGYVRDQSRVNGMTVLFTTHYMDEADKIADELAVIDQGKLIAQGTPASLKERSMKASLEEAFIAMTGHSIRDEEGTSVDQMRLTRRLWRR